MRIGEILDSPVKFVTPLVYAATILLVAASILQVSVTIVYVSWLPGVFFYLMPVVLLSIVLGLSSWGLLVLEKSQRPGIFDHLRRCSLLYFSLVVLGFMSLVAAYKGTMDPGPSALALAFLCTVNAIFVDAVVLILKRWHFGRSDMGSSL